jgi:hypothetical protein
MSWPGIKQGLPKLKSEKPELEMLELSPESLSCYGDIFDSVQLEDLDNNEEDED